MSEETRKVLEMLSNGKISVQEAEQLLQAVASSPGQPDEKTLEPRYFRILVNKPAREGKKAENVNIRVPMTVVRGGLRLGALFPGMLGKKKIQLDNGTELDLSKIHYSDLEAMIKDIGELTVDVDGDDAQVRIRCE
jgi:SHOCT-like domain